jgi:hypothetical protein
MIKYILFLFIGFHLFADKIILKNGKSVQGEVISQNSGVVIIQTAQGKKRISMKEVISVVYVETKAKPARVVQRKKEIPNEPEKSFTPKEESKPIIITEEAPRNSERILEKTEKITVDKELTDKVMQKFEDADKRRAEQTKGEVEALKEEIDYLKKEKDRTKTLNDENEKLKKEMDKRTAGLEIRTRRLEKYLGMDETMVDYYQKPRSPWDLVWRSALFPGWGHRYAREDYTGNTYTSTILILLPIAYFINYQANVAKQALDSSLETKIVSTYLQYTSVGLPVLITNASLYRIYRNYETAIVAIDSQKEFSTILFNSAIFIYLFQIGHAYVTGVEWAKTKPRNYSNEELMKQTGFNFRTIPDNQIQFGSNQRGVEYRMEYSTIF